MVARPSANGEKRADCPFFVQISTAPVARDGDGRDRLGIRRFGRIPVACAIGGAHAYNDCPNPRRPGGTLADGGNNGSRKR